MKDQVKFPIKTFQIETARDIKHNVVVVSARYDRRKTGPVLTFQTGQQEEAGESGFAGFKMAIFGSPSATLVTETGWPRDNKKKVRETLDRAVAEIEQKSGQAYDALVALLAPVGSELVETAELVPAFC